LIVLANELDRAADDGGVARVVALPELVPKHDDALGLLSWRRISGKKPSPQEGTNAPMIRCVRRDV
jgi:hypothetical protein